MCEGGEEWESGRAGERESGRAGEWESGRAGERERENVGEEGRPCAHSLTLSFSRSPILHSQFFISVF